MRTIVAFLSTALLGLGQVARRPPDVRLDNAPEIERVQKRIAENPNGVPPRRDLLNLLLNRNVDLAADKVRELRRQNILWLIEHHPEEANIFEQPQSLLPVRGRLADPAGSAEAAGLWKELAKKPGANPTVIANAAIYLSAIDLPSAFALLENAPDDPSIARARGYVDGAAMLGISGIGQFVAFSSSSAIRNSPEAKAARLEIERSANPYLIGKAGTLLARAQIEDSFNVTFGDDDVFTLGERWLRRAIELAPPGDEWKQPLGQVLQTRAGRTIDPKEKVRLLTEAGSLMPDPAKPGILSVLVAAEFDAGDDSAAERDARRLLEIAAKNAVAYNSAQTILGRVAAAKGDINEAKTRLALSVTMPDTLKTAVFEPNMTLAQDVYDAGDRAAVLEFLEASRAVWKFDRGRIDRMISFIKKAPSADLVQLSRQFPGNEMLRRTAPPFEAKDLDGHNWTREQLAGKVVALEFGKAPLAEKVAKDFAGRGAVLLQISDDDTKRRFEVLTNPTLVVIDRQGNVAAFHSGAATEGEWRTEFETGFGRGPNPVTLPAPKQADPLDGGRVAWEPVDNAESYVVEWDSRDESGWIFDRDRTVRVLPTRETSAILDLTGFARIRWRVYAVPRSGQPGEASPWRELDGKPLTKIYK